MFARREVLGQLITAPVAAGGLAAVLANLDAASAKVSSLEVVEITTEWGLTFSAAWGAPQIAPAASVLMVHEWWGLNGSIKVVAADFVAQGYGALAVDLYGGKVAEDPNNARAYMNQADDDAATETLASWIDWLRARRHHRCCGNGWRLGAQRLHGAPVDATIVYYGNVDRTPKQLSALQGALLGHFATRDRWINKPMVDGFTGAMMATEKHASVFWYDADHAFANPTSGRYDEANAALAWQRTTAFLDENLG